LHVGQKDGKYLEIMHRLQYIKGLGTSSGIGTGTGSVIVRSICSGTGIGTNVGTN